MRARHESEAFVISLQSNILAECEYEGLDCGYVNVQPRCGAG